MTFREQKKYIIDYKQTSFFIDCGMEEIPGKTIRLICITGFEKLYRPSELKKERRITQVA